MLILASVPLQLVLFTQTFAIMFIFSFSLVAVGPVEKCLTELKTPNVLPGEREDIKSQVRNTVLDTSEDFFPPQLFCYYSLPQKKKQANCGLL